MDNLFSRTSLPGLGVFITGKPTPENLNGTDRYDTISGEGGNDVIHLKGGFADFGNGGKGNDKIYGEDGIDNIHGDQDNDYISGGNGDDYLWGDEGNDTILGGLGNDTIHFASGKDTATGGAGADVFVCDGTNIAGGLGIDTITDFHAKGAGQDKLDLRDWGFKWSAHGKGMADGFEVVKVGTHTEIHMSVAHWGTGTIILDKVAVTDISAADFIL